MKPTMTKFPSVDCNYQSVALDEFNGGQCGTRPTSTYWRFSRDYFNAEAKQDLGETAAFATIMITAVVPLVSGALAVLHLCGAFGPL
ncbi:MAG: hypothetical protein QOG48_2308 [Verrucomicrobiota bacterium]|jgi:hypothetical protein